VKIKIPNAEEIKRWTPNDLTIRYVVALLCIALLAIVTHNLMSTFLVEQSHTNSRLRSAKQQVSISEALQRNVVALQLIFSSERMENPDPLFKLTINNLITVYRALEFGNTTHVDSADNTPGARQLIESAKQDFQNMSNLINLLSESNLTNQDTLELATQQFIKANDHFQKSFLSLVKFYEDSLNKHIAYLQKMDFALLTFTLITLLFTGLFIFRPAVRRLYAALKARTAFLSQMSHEIRNPMNTTLGMSELLLKTPLTLQQRLYVDTLRNANSTLLKILNNILEFSAIGSKRNKPENIEFNLYEQINSAVDLIALNAHAKGLIILIEYSFNAPIKIYGDPLALQQIIINLLSNAVKFTQKGEITLKVDLKKTHKHDLIIIEVKDTGIGIDANKLKMIFESFSQADSSVKRRYGGIGLGLTISKELARSIGGELKVTSQKGIGSSFTFDFPIKNPHDVTTLSEKLKQWDLHSINVGVLSERAEIATLVHRYLEHCGAQCTAFADEFELAEWFNTKTKSKQLIIVILDWSLGEKKILAAIDLTVSHKIPLNQVILLVTHTADSQELIRIQDKGIQSLLFKPIKPIEFIQKIRSVASGVVEENTWQRAIKKTRNIAKRRLNILTVDDAEENRFLMQEYLAPLECNQMFFNNAPEAIAQTKITPFDIIFMDIQMPGMDGRTAVQHIREWEKAHNLPPTYIIAVTAHNEEEEISENFNAGFDEHLSKPINLEHLFRMVETAANLQPLSAPIVSPQGESIQSLNQTLDRLQKRITKLAPGYLKERYIDIKKIELALKAEDFKIIESIGHKLKGGAPSYGFEKLGELGNLLEQAAKEHNVLGVGDLLQSITTYVDENSKTLKNQIETETTS
jgi:signal transduction histidine kinase/CheY-like chemotaxis protein